MFYYLMYVFVCILYNVKIKNIFQLNLYSTYSGTKLFYIREFTTIFNLKKRKKFHFLSGHIFMNITEIYVRNFCIQIE